MRNAVTVTPQTLEQRTEGDLTIHGWNDGFPQSQNQPQRRAEEEEFAHFELELGEGPSVQHGGAA